MFINIHSHHPAAGQELVIQNVHSNFEKPLAPGNYSLGLHPWYLEPATWQQQLQIITPILQKSYILALGECGLDKLCQTDWALQQEVFAAQINLANAVNKPLVVHCVRAHDEALRMLARLPVKVPVIFHGFNNRWSIAKQVLDAGHWLSFGTALQQPGLQEVFQQVPINQTFLETDDAATSIELVYAAAAGITNMPIDALSLQLQQNFKTVFQVEV